MAFRPRITADKARKILKDKMIRGKALTDKQKVFFGKIAKGNVKEASNFKEVKFK